MSSASALASRSTTDLAIDFGLCKSIYELTDMLYIKVYCHINTEYWNIIAC